jgi:putative methylase
VRRTELIRLLARLEGFRAPSAADEQVSTPPEQAAELLESARARGDLEGRSVADLGCGPGGLACGAAWLGAAEVVGVERDPAAASIARRNAGAHRLPLRVLEMDVERFEERVDTVVMNPPFGAQRRHADRPFWATALRCARRRIYAFALADSRSFIARMALERSAPVVETRPIRWELTASFPHHRKPKVELPVDLWVIGAAETLP